MTNHEKCKSYKELTFTDDFLFCNILQNNPDICKELVELLLDRKVGKVIFSETQKSIDLALDQKGVRLDVYFEDDLNTAYRCRNADHQYQGFTEAKSLLSRYH